MHSRFSEKEANAHINVVTVIYIILSAWQLLYALQAGGCKSSLCSVRYAFVAYLSLPSFVTAICILCRINFFRICALAIAWGSLFISPLLEVCETIYFFKTGRINSGYPLYLLILWEIVLVLAMVGLRIYIIYILQISKAGYIFLKEHKS